MTRHADYVPLHVHTEYSLLDGAIKIDELIETAVGMKLPALAITDHGNLFGAIQFYKKAVSAGLKPIIGCETYVAPKSRLDRDRQESEETSFHLILLAKDNQGYRNLLALVSKAYLEGFYYKPRIDMELLSQYSSGLIGLSACLKGEVPYYLLAGMPEKAREAALRYREILGPDNFFLEIQSNGMKEQEFVNRKLDELGKELGIGLVATNDCHYLRKEDARAHEILLCIQTGKTISDPKRMKFSEETFYFKSPEEIYEEFRAFPDAVANTKLIAERCNVEIPLGKPLLPKFTPPDGKTAISYLTELAREGLNRLFNSAPPEDYAKRLEYELDVIGKMGFASYFLIVWDFVKYSRENKIPVGPGRGSAAGSLVAYSLDITRVDPIKYGLLFERFLNPERISMPDIDMDFCKDKRELVIEYVSKKYGQDHVAQIITFGTMAAKAAIRDVARALDFPYNEADRIAKLVPETLKMTISDALRLEPQLKELYDTEPKVKELIDIAKRLEGLSRHASTHAAGVVIAPEPLTNIAPLYLNLPDRTISTQFDMKSAEEAGLIKFDFLGLKTLTIIEKTVELIRETGVEFRIEDLPLDDEKTYKLLSSGQTTGIFQLESSGMRDILVRLEPNRFEDLIALVALYRPGPIGSGMIDDFINGKKGGTVKGILPAHQEILDETYGVILYQEQVMSIANKLAGFSLGQADNLRKAMGKKDAEVMEKQRAAFIEGSVKNNIQRGRAEEVFRLMAKFAEYGFNKSHSAAYALIAYQTAYLKAHHAVEFMAATLSADMDNTDKIVKSINECRSMGISILPPDINRCSNEFKVDKGAIRFGLVAVKGVGASAIEAIIAARKEGPFGSIEDFLHRVDNRKANKKVVEALIKAGAFDTLMPGYKDGVVQSLSELGSFRRGAIELCERLHGNAPSLSLFGGAEETGAMGGWDEAELLSAEKEALGFYITTNPITKYRESLRRLGIISTARAEEASDREEIEVAGVVSAIKKLKTKAKAEIMAYVTLEDDEGSIEAIIFPDLLREDPMLFAKDSLIAVAGDVDRTDKGVKLRARAAMKLEKRLEQVLEGMKVEVAVSSNGPDAPAKLRELKRILESVPGKVPLYIRMSFPEKGAEAVINTSLGVAPGEELKNRVEGFLGKGSVKVI